MTRPSFLSFFFFSFFFSSPSEKHARKRLLFACGMGAMVEGQSVQTTSRFRGGENTTQEAKKGGYEEWARGRPSVQQ